MKKDRDKLSLGIYWKKLNAKKKASSLLNVFLCMGDMVDNQNTEIVESQDHTRPEMI